MKFFRSGYKRLSMMSRFFLAFFVTLQLIGSVFFQPSQARADVNDLCTGMGVQITGWRFVDTSGEVAAQGSGNLSGQSFNSGDIHYVSVDLNLTNLDPGFDLTGINEVYTIGAYSGESWLEGNVGGWSSPFYRGDQRDIRLSNNSIFTTGPLKGGNRVIYMYVDTRRGVCKLGSFHIEDVQYPKCTQPVHVYRKDASDPTKSCYANSNFSCVDTTHELFLKVDGLQNGDGTAYNGKVNIGNIGNIDVANGSVAERSIGKLAYGNHTFPVYVGAGGLYGGYAFKGVCSQPFTVINNCGSESNRCSTTPPTSDTGRGTAAFDLCSQVPTGSPAHSQCITCVGKNGVWTAVGCIVAEPSSIVKTIITIGVGIGGGVALLMTLVGGFLLTTSQGNPKQQETAKEMITSAVIGLLFVLFSVIILQFIGVTILQIPGFGTTGS